MILSFMMLLIGYSSFAVLVVRSNSNPPIDENNPEDAVGLLSYLKRTIWKLADCLWSIF